MSDRSSNDKKQRSPGSRYSFGYPVCPNLPDQDKIPKLLEIAKIVAVLGV
jgi:cobalamin-dependent methionine synthase I